LARIFDQSYQPTKEQLVDFQLQQALHHLKRSELLKRRTKKIPLPDFPFFDIFCENSEKNSMEDANTSRSKEQILEDQILQRISTLCSLQYPTVESSVFMSRSVDLKDFITAWDKDEIKLSNMMKKILPLFEGSNSWYNNWHEILTLTTDPNIHVSNLVMLSIECATMVRCGAKPSIRIDI
jgi:hypothetical protein